MPELSFGNKQFQQESMKKTRIGIEKDARVVVMAAVLGNHLGMRTGGAVLLKALVGGRGELTCGSSSQDGKLKIQQPFLRNEGGQEVVGLGICRQFTSTVYATTSDV